jgi:hypothetical protein
MTAATSVSPASRTSAYFGCSNDTFATKSVEVTTPSFGKGVLQTFLSSIALANRCPWQCQRPNCGWCRLRMRRKRHSSYLDVREPPRLAKNAVPQSTPAAPSIKAAARPRPSAMPPVAMTGMFSTASTTAGIGLRAGSEMSYITADGSRVSDAPPLRRSNGGRSSGY